MNTNNKTTLFSDAINSIDENGAYAIANDKGTRIKQIMLNLKRECRAAASNGNCDMQCDLVSEATKDILLEIASMMTAMDRIDMAYSDFLREIENSISTTKATS